jgi:hypothetical protein
MVVDKFFILLHSMAISYPLDNLLKMNEVCMEEIILHTQLLEAHRSMSNSILRVNLHRHFLENDCHHILKTICEVQYLHLAGVEFYYQF